MKKIVIAVVFLFSLIFLIGFAVFGDRGFMHMIKLRDELREIELSNVRLREENEQLKKEIGFLKSDLKYLEEKARSELGLVKDGELLYRLKKENK